jgi:hypothetical protein
MFRQVLLWQCVRKVIPVCFSVPDDMVHELSLMFPHIFYCADNKFRLAGILRHLSGDSISCEVGKGTGLFE